MRPTARDENQAVVRIRSLVRLPCSDNRRRWCVAQMWTASLPLTLSRCRFDRYRFGEAHSIPAASTKSGYTTRLDERKARQ